MSKTDQPEKHATAAAFIVSTEQPARTLLVHHKSFNKWHPPGGHCRPYENPVETVIREVAEESGIDVASCFSPSRVLDARASALPLPRYLLEERIANDDGGYHYHTDHVYLITVPHQPARYQEAEAYEIGWFTKEECMTLEMFENVRLCLLEIFDQL